MARRSSAIPLVWLGASLAVALAAITAGASAPDSEQTLDAALRHLSAGRHETAERVATRLARRKDLPAPRAWLIVAASRQRRGRNAQAIEAYQEFLRSCESANDRDYALREIRACREPTRAAPKPLPPSKLLTKGQKADLAKVEDEFFTESSDHFIVRAKNRKLPGLLAREAERVLGRICGQILRGQAYPHSVDITVWPDRKQYLANAEDAPEWSGGRFEFIVKDGIAIRKIDLTQRDAEGRFDAVMLDRVLPHEMCHLVLKEFFGDTRSPMFLDEGLAMLAESERDTDRLVLAGAALTGKAGISLGQLLLRGEHNIRRPDVFYAEAFSFISFLHERMSPEQFRAFLEGVKDGCAAGEAIQRALCLPADPDFLPKLAVAWQDRAITDAQILRALGDKPLSVAKPG